MYGFEELRRIFPVFSFDSYDVERADCGMKVTYHFTQSADIRYAPSWVIPFSYDEYANDIFFRRILFCLGMAELVSYWKACVSPRIEIKCGYLDAEQIKWWKKLYFNGLGEFFYRNGIKTDTDSFTDITPLCSEFVAECRKDVFSGNIICVGGGKDSCVTMELTRGDDNVCYAVNGSPAIFRTARAAGYADDRTVIFKRILDRKIVEMNGAGYLNGHTPFSSVVAFSAYLFAYLSGRRYIVLSNEASANDVYVAGTEVNHQYSKSMEFENDFRAYTSRYLTDKIEYFSLLRPLNEWNICRIFSRYADKYLKAFLSCNLGTKNDRWCLECPKCLFTYIMLSPFCSQEKLCDAFGENLLDAPRMIKYLAPLVCESLDKPFECIGTRPEINAALKFCTDKYGTSYALLREYKEKYYDGNACYCDVERFFDKNTNVPPAFAERAYGDGVING